MPHPSLKPFWRYYGGKWRAAPRYPKPLYDTIVEPFAGAAGYSLRYPDRKIILVEKYAVIAEIWRYLIRVSPEEIFRIPSGVEHVDDLPGWVPTPAQHLVGWWMNSATTSPCKQLSVGHRRMAATGRKFEGWTDATKERVASQLQYIRHWQILEGDYTEAPDVEATWFIDPPYNNRAGSYYVESDLDYGELADWCQSRRGQAMVCENEGATWLPFEPFAVLKPGLNGKGSREVLWQSRVDGSAEIGHGQA